MFLSVSLPHSLFVYQYLSLLIPSSLSLSLPLCRATCFYLSTSLSQCVSISLFLPHYLSSYPLSLLDFSLFVTVCLYLPPSLSPNISVSPSTSLSPPLFSIKDKEEELEDEEKKK